MATLNADIQNRFAALNEQLVTLRREADGTGPESGGRKLGPDHAHNVAVQAVKDFAALQSAVADFVAPLA